MKLKLFILIIFCSIIQISCTRDDNTITISGRAMDFEGNPIDSCLVAVYYTDFTTAYSAYTDSGGYYTIPDVAKGKYMAIYGIRPKEYPLQSEVAKEDMRLEFWAWNVVADKDLTINPRYHRLELYGTTVFRLQGGYPGVIIYTRPMSLGRHLSSQQEGDTSVDAIVSDLSVDPDDIEFKVYADDVPVAIQSVQPVMEYIGGDRQIAYLIYADLPEKQPEKYCIFRIEAFNRAYGGEKGENVYFYEIPGYKTRANADKTQ